MGFTQHSLAHDNSKILVSRYFEDLVFNTSPEILIEPNKYYKCFNSAKINNTNTRSNTKQHTSVKLYLS